MRAFFIPTVSILVFASTRLSKEAKIQSIRQFGVTYILAFSDLETLPIWTNNERIPTGV